MGKWLNEAHMTDYFVAIKNGTYEELYNIK